jgi:nitrite reductase (NO-forming)
MAWFVVGSAVAAWIVAAGGAGAAGWRMGPLIAPIGLGWIAQVLIGAWSHLVPAVGPGGPERHAAQRRVLGRLANLRLLTLNSGVLLATAGELASETLLVQAGLVLAAAAIGAAVVLLALAFARRDVERARPAATLRS